MDTKRSRKGDHDRLYRLKLQYVALILIPLALLLYSDEERLTAWWRLPYRSVADALLSTAIVVLVFEWFLHREEEARLSQMVRDTVHKELGPLARSFFANPQTLLQALSEPALREVINAALGIMLRDTDLAAGIDDGLLRTIAKYRQRWKNARFTVTLCRIQDHPSPSVRDRYFEAYLNVQFETVLDRTEFGVWCVDSEAAFDEIFWGNAFNFLYVWHQPPTPEFPAVSEASFEVVRLQVNETRLAIMAPKKLDGHRMLVTCHSERLGQLVGQPVRVEATFKLKVPKRAHRLNLSVPVPTHGIAMTMYYSDTDIRHVKAIDMFHSGARPDIRELPPWTRPQGVEVRLREWTLPGDGVVFLWHLEQEQHPLFNDLLSDPTSVG